MQGQLDAVRLMGMGRMRLPGSHPAPPPAAERLSVVHSALWRLSFLSRTREAMSERAPQGCCHDPPKEQRLVGVSCYFYPL